MEEFNIKKPRGATRHKKVLGRGAGTGRGSTAGRGSKGQNSRSGGRTRVGFEGGQMPLYRRIARRGFSNYPFKADYTTVAVGALEVFSNGDTVNRQSLIDRRIVRRRAGLIKILGNGALSKKLIVEVDKVTAGARKAIEAAGGTVVGAPAPAEGPSREEQAQPAKAPEPPKAEASKGGAPAASDAPAASEAPAASDAPQVRRVPEEHEEQ